MAGHAPYIMPDGRSLREVLADVDSHEPHKRTRKGRTSKAERSVESVCSITPENPNIETNSACMHSCNCFCTVCQLGLLSTPIMFLATLGTGQAKSLGWLENTKLTVGPFGKHESMA